MCIKDSPAHRQRNLNFGGITVNRQRRTDPPTVPQPAQPYPIKPVPKMPGK
jgi:hypothetical protein